MSNNKKEIRDELIDYILKITNKDKQEKVLNKLNEVNAKDENYDSKLENLEDILIQIFYIDTSMIAKTYWFLYRNDYKHV